MHRGASCGLHGKLATRFAPPGPLADNDLDVMPKRVKKAQELVSREPVKLATDQSGDFRLIDAEHLGSGNLRQSVPFDDLRDAQRQFSFYEQLVGVLKLEIGEHVAGVGATFLLVIFLGLLAGLDPLFMFPLGPLQAGLDKVNLCLRCRDALFRLFLESVKDVNSIAEFHGVDRTIRIPVKMLHDLEHSSTLEALQRFGVDVLVAVLRRVECLTDDDANVLRELLQVLARAANPKKRFRARGGGLAVSFI